MKEELTYATKELAKHRLEQAKEDLEAGKLLYDKNFYKLANNRSYYSIFHSIKAVLALEPVDFKRHKDVVAYFNRTYAATEKIPREIGRKLARLQQKREKSDYDDFYIASKEETMEQIENTKSVILAVKDYLSRMEN